MLPALLPGALAATAAQPSRDLVKAVTRGDCNAAGRLANEGMKANDAQVIFLIGRMLAEGVCIQSDAAAATPYFAHAAAQGLAPAEIEYGLQIGLGEGVDQSYERAGDLCQKGGLERTGGGSSLYSLGYVCTVRGLASRHLRETIPRGAFKPGTRAARVSFNPVTGVMKIRATPPVTTAADTTTGTFVQRPLIDAQGSIDKSWQWAMSAVPRPDVARLESEEIQVTLDLDMTIEGDAAAGPGAHLATNGFLMPSDIPAPPVSSSFSH